MSSLAPASRVVRVALVQLGNVTPDKSFNLRHARDMVLEAASGSAAGKPDLIVLPASEPSSTAV
jgi:omega-amidase